MERHVKNLVADLLHAGRLLLALLAVDGVLFMLHFVERLLAELHLLLRRQSDLLMPVSRPGAVRAVIEVAPSASRRGTRGGYGQKQDSWAE